MTRTAPPNTTGLAHVARPEPGPSRLRSALLLAAVLLGQFMAVLDSSIVNVAVPAIRNSLDASGSGLQLIVSGYVISFAVLLVTGARLGDRFGQRRMFLFGLAVFTVASLACGLAWNPLSLIVFRFVQGAGAAALVPQVMTLIQRNFDGPARARALSIFATVASGATIIGQIGGGFLVDWNVAGTDWRAVFLVNVPIGVVLLILTPRVVPSTTGTVGRRVDLAGLVTLTPAILLLVLPLMLGHEQHWSLWIWIAFGCAAACFVAFVLTERQVSRRGGDPLFAGRVLRAPGLLPVAATLLVVMALFSGWMFVAAIHLQSTLGYSALHAGLLFLPCGGVFAVTSLSWQAIPPRLLRWMIPAGLVVAGLAIGAVGLLLRDGRDIGPGALALFGVLGAGIALAYSPAMTRALAKVSPELAADAGGILVTCSQLGVVAGVAVFGSIFLTTLGTTAISAAHALAVTAVVEGVTAVAGAAVAAYAMR